MGVIPLFVPHNSMQTVYSGMILLKKVCDTTSFASYQLPLIRLENIGWKSCPGVNNLAN